VVYLGKYPLCLFSSPDKPGSKVDLVFFVFFSRWCEVGRTSITKYRRWGWAPNTFTPKRSGKGKKNGVRVLGGGEGVLILSVRIHGVASEGA